MFILLSFAFFLGTKLPLYCFDLSYFVCCQRWVRWLYSECCLEGRAFKWGAGGDEGGRFTGSLGSGFWVLWVANSLVRPMNARIEIAWETLWVSLLPGFISWLGNRRMRLVLRLVL